MSVAECSLIASLSSFLSASLRASLIASLTAFLIASLTASLTASLNAPDRLSDRLSECLFDGQVGKSKSPEVRELFGGGFGVHHAGMLRADRGLSERLFSEGLLNVLVCTATLAWGVNLPAHTVIIKGTQLYDPEKGSFKDLGVLDVMQIFGRAGRPQFDTNGGEGIIITQHAKLAHYLQMLTSSIPIESQFVSRLCDHMNAEIALGTVTSVREAVTWLSSTYLHLCMQVLTTAPCLHRYAKPLRGSRIRTCTCA